jgi:hypothetical protein
MLSYSGVAPSSTSLAVPVIMAQSSCCGCVQGEDGGGEVGGGAQRRSPWPIIRTSVDGRMNARTTVRPFSACSDTSQYILSKLTTPPLASMIGLRNT